MLTSATFRHIMLTRATWSAQENDNGSACDIEFSLDRPVVAAIRYFDCASGPNPRSLRNQVFSYDELSVEMKLLKRRVALLERPVAAPSVQKLTPVDRVRTGRGTDCSPGTDASLPVEPEIAVENCRSASGVANPIRRLCPLPKHRWRSRSLNLHSRVLPKPVTPGIGKR